MQFQTGEIMTTQPSIGSFIKVLIFSVLLCFISLALFSVHFYPTLRHDIKPYGANLSNPIAKRVVFIVADGLREDIAFSGIFNNGTLNMPFIKKKIQSQGSICLISVARAPTESRVNHMTMFGGFPEELYNLFNGWKLKDPNFDHILNRSKYGFALGGPDVVNYFDGDNVYLKSFDMNRYHGERDPSNLDLWTVQNYERLLNEPSLSERVNSNGALFFLHLAGIDTNGHRHGALSSYYRDNVEYVDSVVARIETITQTHFGDEKTLFIFTSDHGFPDQGGHGGKDYHNTHCPLVVWGVNGRLSIEKRLTRINQAQIASLVSGIMGFQVPVNNLESFPSEIQVLGLEERAKILASNYGQLLYEYNSQSKSTDKRSSKKLEDLIASGMYEKCIVEATNSINRIKRDRKILMFTRSFLPSIPLLIGALALYFGCEKEFQLSLRKLILSMVIGLFWSKFVRFPIFDFISACSAMMLSLSLGVPKRNFDFGILICGIIFGSILWDPRLSLVPLILWSFYLRSVDLLLVGLSIWVRTVEVDFKGIEALLAVILAGSYFYKLGSIFGQTSQLQEKSFKFLFIVATLSIKANLAIHHFVPVTWRIALLMWLFIINFSCLVLVAILLKRDGQIVNVKIKIAFYLTALAVLTDPIWFLTTVLIVLSHYNSFKNSKSLQYTSIHGVEADFLAFELISWISLVAIGPLGILKYDAYWPTILNDLKVAFGLGQTIVAILINLFVLITINKEQLDSDRKFYLKNRIVPLSIRFTIPIIYMMLIMQPYNESWKIITFGIVKTLIPAGIPFISACVVGLI